MEQEKRIGLFGSTTFIVGCIIGAGVFVMTGALARQVGPGVYIAYIIALIPAVGQGLTYAQLGSAIPTTSGQYSYLSMLVHPLVGFAIAWISVLSGGAIMATICFGFANYANVFLPAGTSDVLLASACLIVFVLLHLKGIKDAEMAQNLMVIFLAAALALFVIAGIPAIKPELATPLFPNGTGVLLVASASLFFSYLGFSTVTDIGEEVKDPGRTIPLSIIISAVIVGFLYIGIAFVLPRVMPYNAIGQASLVEAGRVFLPSWGGPVMRAAAICAILTTISSSLLINSRMFYAMARDGWFPKSLMKTSKNGSPYVALLCTYAISQIFISTNMGIVYLGTMGSVSVLVATALIAFGPVFLPKRYPKEHAKAVFKLPKWLNIIIAVLTAGICTVLCISTVKGFMSIWLVIGGWLLPGMVLYYVKTKKKAKSNVNTTM